MMFPGAQEHCLNGENLETQASDNSVSVNHTNPISSTSRVALYRRMIVSRPSVNSSEKESANITIAGSQRVIMT